jgi:L-aspartate oxidase
MTKLANLRRARVVVVGSGLAGLSTALGLRDCVVLTRGRLGSGSSGHAQGGIAAALAPDDHASYHAADTLSVSGGLGDAEVARAVTEAAAGRIEWLCSLGARFDVDAEGRLALGREAGHRARRIVHAGGDATGAEVMRALTDAARGRPDIEICAEHELVDLVVSAGRVAGVLALAPSGELVAVLAPAVVLATGGIGGVYARTTNPPEVAGDGLAAAARAGATLADLEFVQFHPTALNVDADPAPLLTEALRGKGAVLVNDRGERFMVGRHPDAELAPRDLLAREIWAQHARGRTVYLGATEAVGLEFPRRFPSVWRESVQSGIDPRSAALPVTPAEHYFMGGIATDSSGRTSLPGLWAVGEVAGTGLHGANRLASNSLLEAMVLGAAASRSVLASDLPRAAFARLEVPADALRVQHASDNTWTRAIRALMWERVGLVRDAHGLAAAIAELERLQMRERQTECSFAERNLLLVARLIATAALSRQESRGAHWRADCPQAKPELARRSFVRPRRARPTLLRALARRAA